MGQTSASTLSLFGKTLSEIGAPPARPNPSTQNAASSQNNGPLQNVQPNSTAPLAANPALPVVYAPLQLVQFSLPLSQGGGVESSAQAGSTPAPANGQAAAANANANPVNETSSQTAALNQIRASLNVFGAGDEAMRAALNLTV